MKAIEIKPNDEVITTPFTFISTAETIASLKAKPIFVDIEEDTLNIDPKKIKAKHINGVLEVIMPKKKASTVKTVNIDIE